HVPALLPCTTLCRSNLKKVINITEEEEKQIGQVLSKFRMGITPYYASLMDPDDPNCPIRKQAVPTIMETHESIADMEDPLAEDEDRKSTRLNSSHVK